MNTIITFVPKFWTMIHVSVGFFHLLVLFTVVNHFIRLFQIFTDSIKPHLEVKVQQYDHLSLGWLEKGMFNIIKEDVHTVSLQRRIA